ncbi:MAG: glycosyltransferase family 39 protein [Candidatus Woesearchaeota archaeon]
MNVMKHRKWILFAVFLIVLSMRLYFAFQTDNFSSDEAYFTLRQVENIKSTGLPLIKDDLSFSGRTYIVLPVYYYILAGFNLVLPIGFVGKVIPNILASLLIFVIYLITERITRSRKAALMTAVLSGFVPIFFSKTINTISPYSLVIPLSFLLIYFFISLNEKRRFIYFVITFVILLLMHPSLIIIVLGLMTFLFFVRIEKLKQSRQELEVILFTFLVSIWFYIIIFKDIFLFHGPRFLWQNVPEKLYSQYFSNISFLTIINQISLFSFIFGIYIIYRFVIREKKRELYIFISLAIPLLILITLKFITINMGIMFLSIVMLILFGYFFKILIHFFEKTKFERYKKLGISLFYIAALLTMIIPSLIYAKGEINNSFRDNEIKVLEWIRDNTAEDSVIVSFPGQGNLITSVTKRKNVIDTDFLMIPQIDQRYDDINKIYTTNSVIEAIHLLSKYNAKYIYFSTDRLIKNFGINEIKYLDDKCFVPIFGKDKVLVYELRCEVR